MEFRKKSDDLREVEDEIIDFEWYLFVKELFDISTLHEGYEKQLFFLTVEGVVRVDEHG